jgi:preprotein translocase subunit SecD
LKKYFTFRVWILIVALIFAGIAISPNPYAEGLEVSNVVSTDLSNAGLAAGMAVYSIGDDAVTNVADVSAAISNFAYESKQVVIETSNQSLTYDVTNDILFKVNENLTIEFTELEFGDDAKLLSINGDEISSNEEFEDFLNSLIPLQTIKIETDAGLIAYLSREVPEFTVKESTKSNLVFGLDFTGGTRVLIQPVSENGTEITDEDIETLIDVLSERLNVYGLSDLKIRSASDWEGNKYVLIEIAGVTEQEVQELIAQQGVFEAKIGDESVFFGGQEDITYVCRNDGSCSGVRTCNPAQEGGYFCQFDFTIRLSEESAQRFADITKDIPLVLSDGGDYLEKTIDFYLDGEQVDSLNIAASLKGQVSTTISISGPGYGPTQNDAIDDGLANMNTLQTILITGSLPFDIEVAKIDTVSPVLGETFLKNVIWVSFFAILAVAIVLFIRYRTFKVVLPVMGAMVTELILILGFAAMVRWNLDMAAIAGILAAVGTGVDDQIVILDETIQGQNKSINWKEKIKRAFFIIMVAYATTVAAMIPLWNAGAGLIRGFALTTIAGVTIGVFITRPAFASIVERLFKE